MKNRAVVAAIGAGMAAIAAVVFVVGGKTAEAAIIPKVLIMRCVAMPETMGYQVVALSHTADLSLNITPGTVPGQGDDCAVAISQIYSIQGVTSNILKMQVNDTSIVVTLIK